MVNSHRGLQAARALGALRNAGIVTPQPAEKKSPVLRKNPTVPEGPAPSKPSRTTAEPTSTFSWPSTDAEETRGAGDSDLELKPESRLRQLGYDTSPSRSARWRVLPQ